ncbi:MAG TPA: ribonuclease H-like domain-containing protein [Solirubrobacteraceae bacterium]
MSSSTPPAGEGILPETFVHLEGIGPKTERRLWQAGILDWETLARTPLARRANIAGALERSRRALECGDLDYFFMELPASERWRAFADFGPQFVAVDIETTGLSTYDELTMIGIESAGQYRTFVRGANLADAVEVLGEAKGLITFNGALFDLPFIARTFPELELPRAHVDLRFLARRVGLAGSLKTVEHEAELDRGAELTDITGHEATVLWSEYEYEGRRSSLRDLVRYNAADTCVLRPLAELVVDRLYQSLTEDRGRPAEEQRLFDPDLPAGLPRTRRTPTPAVRPPRVSAGASTLKVGRQTLALPQRRSTQPRVTIGDLTARMRDPDARIVGIDLTGSESRPSGWALLEGVTVITGMLSSTEEILARTLACSPRIVSIDSPLALPAGRDCTEDSCECRSFGITRHCERTLKRRGVNVYPCLIQSMQALTRRGIAIAEALRAEGVEVIESYPGAAQDIMRIPRKRASLNQLQNGLERFGLRGLRPAGALTHDELDAATSAVVGSFYLAELHEALGDDTEGYLITPSLPEGMQHSEPRERCEDEPAGVGICMLIGAGASAHAGALGLAIASEVQDAAEPDKILAGDDLEDYWRALAEHGPSLRAVVIEPPGTRLPRRPRFADLQLRVDDPQRLRKLRRWSRQWMPPAD